MVFVFEGVVSIFLGVVSFFAGGVLVLVGAVFLFWFCTGTVDKGGLVVCPVVSTSFSTDGVQDLFLSGSILSVCFVTVFDIATLTLFDITGVFAPLGISFNVGGASTVLDKVILFDGAEDVVLTFDDIVLGFKAPMSVFAVTVVDLAVMVTVFTDSVVFNPVFETLITVTDDVGTVFDDVTIMIVFRDVCVGELRVMMEDLLGFSFDTTFFIFSNIIVFCEVEPISSWDGPLIDDFDMSDDVMIGLDGTLTVSIEVWTLSGNVGIFCRFSTGDSGLDVFDALCWGWSVVCEICLSPASFSGIESEDDDVREWLRFRRFETGSNTRNKSGSGPFCIGTQMFK